MLWVPITPSLHHSQLWWGVGDSASLTSEPVLTTEPPRVAGEAQMCLCCWRRWHMRSDLQKTPELCAIKILPSYSIILTEYFEIHRLSIIYFFFLFFFSCNDRIYVINVILVYEIFQPLTPRYMSAATEKPQVIQNEQIRSNIITDNTSLVLCLHKDFQETKTFTSVVLVKKREKDTTMQ